MKKSFFLLSIMFCLFGTIELKAQPPGGPGGGGTTKPGCDNPPCVPIDGGISILLIAGAAFGGKKMFDIQNKEDKTIV